MTGSPWVPKKKNLQGPAKVLYEKYGSVTTQFLPKQHKDLGFPQCGSFHHVSLRTLRKRMAKGFEVKIKKAKVQACKKSGAAVPSTGHPSPPCTGLLDYALKTHILTPQKTPCSPAAVWSPVTYLDSRGLGIIRSGTVYQPKRPTPILDSSSAAHVLVQW